MRHYGLLGRTLTHSFSPMYFSDKFIKENIKDAEYSAYEIKTIDDIGGFLARGLDGFNVTIPYKKEIILYLDEVDEDALKIGAVNCVIKINNGYKGYNTDLLAFLKSLESFLQNKDISKALVFGDGGAAKAIQYALDKKGIRYDIISRKSENKNYHELTDSDLKAATLLINTTPLGMFPNTDTCPPINYNAISDGHFLFDLVYNPLETKFLTYGKERGAAVKNGYEMLILQAEASWAIWNARVGYTKL